MNEQPAEASPVTKVARDLTEIVRLAEALQTQARHKANATIDGTGLPGGLAMIALAAVANVEAWQAQYEARERWNTTRTDKPPKDVSYIEDEDDTWEPPLQTLRFWSDQWRKIHAAEWDHIPTVATEANFIRYQLDWAWDQPQPLFDVFAADIRKARMRLENTLYAGERSQRGAPCLYDECHGKRLVRNLEPYSQDGQKSWRWSNWHCPKCHREWDQERYVSNVAAAAWAAQREEIAGEVWCTPKYAARQVGRPEATVRSWLSKGLLTAICVVRGKRSFVRLADVEERHQNSEARKGAA